MGHILNFYTVHHFYFDCVNSFDGYTKTIPTDLIFILIYFYRLD